MIESTLEDQLNNFSKLFTIIRAKVKVLSIIAKRNLATNAAEKSEFQMIVYNLFISTENFINSKGKAHNYFN